MDARLLDAVRSKNIVVVVGTGISAALSGSPTATWRGLLDSGISRLGEFSPPALLRNIRDNVAYGFDNDDIATVLHAADRLKGELDRAGAAALSKWLEDDIGLLEVTDPRVGDALRKLPFPILTTNYDTLLCAGDRQSVTWRDPEGLQAIVTGQSRNIGHLHGAWRDASSIVLSHSDYENLLQAEAFQSLQRAVQSLKSLVYVGYGAGLSDPNFGRLIKLHSEQFGAGQVKHFRLCRDSELAALEREHLGDHIIPVTYGEHYSDLPDFIGSMSDAISQAAVSDAGIVRDLAGDACLSLSDSLIQESIIAEARDSSARPAFEEVILPPVLLPVPHAQFINAQRSAKEDKDKVSRTNPVDDAKGCEVMLLVGEEGSGISTASKWLALESARHRGGVIPIGVSFRQVGSGPRPLLRLVETTARARGWTLNAGDPLPAHILIVDDFSPYVSKISDRTIVDFASSDAVAKIINCSLGTEEEVAEKLTAAGVAFTIRYMGKLSRKDIELYARAASPIGYTDIATRVIDTLTSENLARTPYTVGLLISVLMRGATVTANASQTTILDDYVGALLGRGDPHEDARLGLDQNSREALLSAFAKYFVMHNTGGISESDAVVVFEDALARFSWSESPTEVLQSLVDRKVLKRSAGRIVFTRSSFLHLFAAKRGLQDTEFRNLLLTDPLHYAQILRDYAALHRNDADLVATLNHALLDGHWDEGAGGVFSVLAVVDGPGELGGAPEKDRTSDAESKGGEIDFFEMTSDGDITPFPTTQHENLPPAARLMRVLELASIVLRESDQVEDGVMKQEVLMNILAHWGYLMSTLEKDSDFARFVEDLGGRLYDSMTEDEVGEAHLAPDIAERSDVIKELGLLFPAAIALGGLTEYLASRRLIRPLVLVADSARASGRPELSVSTAFMVFSVKERGWPQVMRGLIDNRENIWVVRNFLLPLLINEYTTASVARADEEDLLQLCADIVAHSHRYESDAQKRTHRGQVLQSIKKARLDRTRRGGDGMSSDE